MSAADAMIGIRYIGSKPFKTDNVNHTRTVWNGKGDVKPYPARLAAKLLYLHEDIWEIAEQSGAIRPALPQPAAVKIIASAPQASKPDGLHRDAPAIPQAHIRQAPPASSVLGVLSLPDDSELLERLSCEELGAYMRLASACAAGDEVADDDAALAAIVRLEVERWNEIRPAVARFFSIIGGRWRHRAIETAIAAAAKVRLARAERGRNAARTRWGGKPSTSKG